MGPERVCPEKRPNQPLGPTPTTLKCGEVAYDNMIN